MPVNNLNFASQVEEWVRNSEALLEGVFHESAQRVTDVMTTPRGQGGNLPVDTGYLWHSIQASNVAPPPIDPGSKGVKGQSYALDSGPVNLTINNTELGGTVFICATAAYAMRINYGFTGEDSLGRTYSQQGALFVEQAAQQWPQIVAQVQTELKAKLGGV